jgi:hypothetical protein
MGCMALVALFRTLRWMDIAACSIIAKYLLDNMPRARGRPGLTHFNEVLCSISLP